MAKKRQQILLPDEIAKWLKDASQTTGVPMSRIIEDALKLYRRQPEIGLMLKYRTPQRECLYCGADRTGQGSLIATPGGQVFCNEAHYDKWREKQQAWQDEEK